MKLWFGPLVSVVGLLSYFMFFVRFPFFRDTAILNLVLVCLGLGLAFYGVLRAWRTKRTWLVKTGVSLGLGFSLLCAGLLFSYVFSMSYSMPTLSAETLAIESLPAITLQDQHGKDVALRERNGKGLILTFYRGHW